MLKKIKIALRQICPPFFYTILRGLQKRKYSFFDGNYKTWNDALKNTQEGYEAKKIFKKVYDASLRVQKGKALYERDGICFNKEQYRWPVISMIIQAEKKIDVLKHFHVLDFGGSLGSFYNQHHKLLTNIKKLKWSIVEQDHFVKKGKEEFENNTLKFYSTIDECSQTMQPNLALFSSVIQYIEEPYEILEQLILSSPETIIIDRTPFINSEHDTVKLQYLSQEMGGAIYPSWFFSEKKFLNFFNSHGYKKFLSFECEEDFGVGKFKGIVLKKTKMAL